MVLDTKQIKPVFVQHQGANEEQPDEIDLDEFDFERSGYVIRSGQPISKKVCGYPIWHYVPFNLFNEKKFYQDFEDKVKRILGWTKKELDNPRSWGDEDIKKLRKVYQSFSTSINDNSLMVLSDCTEGAWEIRRNRFIAESLHSGYYSLYAHYHLWRGKLHPNCLYTGDTVLKRNVKKSKYVDRYEDFLKELNRFTKRISLMQIPHHGSSNNNNLAALCDCVSLCLFCSFGTKDMSKKTFLLIPSKIETLWKNIIKVTEQKDTVFEERCYLSI